MGEGLSSVTEDPPTDADGRNDMSEQQKKTKDIPRKATRRRGKYAAYRARKGKPTRDGNRVHNKRPKPTGVMVNRYGGDSIIGDSGPCINAARTSL
jgi:hypothetical protein